MSIVAFIIITTLPPLVETVGLPVTRPERRVDEDRSTNLMQRELTARWKTPMRGAPG